MDGRLECVTGPDGPACSEQPWLGAAPMVTEPVVEQLVQARAHGEAVAAIALAYGLDRKAVQRWTRRGQ